MSKKSKSVVKKEVRGEERIKHSNHRSIIYLLVCPIEYVLFNVFPIYTIN